MALSRNSPIKLIIASIMVAVFSFFSTPVPGKELGDNHVRDALEHAGQLVVVTAGEWGSREAVLRRYERSPQHIWVEVGAPVTVVTGKNGLAWGVGLHGSANHEPNAKKEGDGKAPAGVFLFGTAFGYTGADKPEVQKLKIPYVQATSSLVCVDDPDSSYYNRLIDSSTVDASQWNSAEKMLRKDALYSWGVVVEHNAGPRVPGRGSCIFLHVWRAPGHPTVGCTALDAENLKAILQWLDRDKQPVLVQLPMAVYSSKRKEWQLP